MTFGTTLVFCLVSSRWNVFYPKDECCRYIIKAHTCPPKYTLSHPRRHQPSDYIRVPTMWCGNVPLYRDSLRFGHLIEISSFDAANVTQMLHWLNPSANLPLPVSPCCTLPSIEKQHQLCWSEYNGTLSYLHGRVCQGEGKRGMLLIVTLYFWQEGENVAACVHMYLRINRKWGAAVSC